MKQTRRSFLKTLVLALVAGPALLAEARPGTEEALWKHLVALEKAMFSGEFEKLDQSVYYSEGIVVG